MHGLVHNLLVQFFTLGSPKIKGSDTHFFEIVTTHNDHPSYVRHVLGSNSVFFPLFGCARGGFSARWTCQRQHGK